MSAAGLAALEPIPVMLPITGAVVAPLVARFSRRAPLVVSVASTAGAAVVLALFAHTVYGGRIVVHYLGHVGPIDGHVLGITFAADSFGLTYALLTAVVGAVLLMYTLSELHDLGARELGGYACLFQLLLAALIGSALTADLFDLFVWFEVAALASYGLTGFFLDRPYALEAAFKILVLTTIASFGIFIGAALIYSRHGALNLGQVHDALGSGVHTADLVALALLVSGFATKAGLMPFHGWLPDAHTACPGPVSALFSGLMVNLGVFAIARLCLQVYGGAGRPVLGALTVVGCVSAVIGAVFALAQDDLKRLLAYDTISQMGVLTVGFATRSVDGAAGATYHLIDHALFKALLFLCAGAIVHSTGVENLSDMGGLARRRPVLAVAFVVGALAIAGVPPLNGYASLGLIHDELRSGDPVAFAVVLVAQVVTIAALSRATYLAFFRRRDRDYDELDPPRAGMVAAFAVLGLGCVAFGVMPNFVVSHVAAPAGTALVTPGAYAHAALSGTGRLATTPVSFDYWDPIELLTVAGTVAAGLLLCWWYVRREREPHAMTLLRRVQNGSVNDYAAYATAGLVVMIAVVGLGH